MGLPPRRGSFHASAAASFSTVKQLSISIQGGAGAKIPRVHRPAPGQTGKTVTSQLLLFEIEPPEAAELDLHRRTVSEVERAAHLRRLQAAFDAIAQHLQRCEECRGYVASVDAFGNCSECRELT